jgi:hypothetical protein
MSIAPTYKILTKISRAEENEISVFEIIKKKGRPSFENDIKINAIAEIVQFDNCLNQKQMKVKMREKNLICSQPTISRLLSKAELTRKRVKYRPAITQTPVHLENGFFLLEKYGF